MMADLKAVSLEGSFAGKELLWARLSLSFLWLFTGLTSWFFAPYIGYEILASAGIGGGLAQVCVVAGSVLDITLGVWLLSGKALVWCYRVQLLVIVLFTVLLTIIAPGYWLHPFGPVTKNLPVLALIGLLLSDRSQRA